MNQISGYQIIQSHADVSLNEDGEFIENGKEMMRLALVPGDSRFHIALKMIAKRQEISPKDIDKIQSGRYIQLFDNDGNMILLKVRSIASRLHLRPNQVHLLKEEVLRRLGSQARLLSMLFNEMKEDDFLSFQDIQELIGLVIQMKVIRDCEFPQVSARGILKGHDLVISRNNQDFIKIYEVEEVLGQGGYGTVEAIRNILTQKILAMKSAESEFPFVNSEVMKSASESSFVEEEKPERDLYNEFRMLSLLNANGDVVGIQSGGKKLLTYVTNDGQFIYAYLTTKYDSNFYNDIREGLSLEANMEVIYQLLFGLRYMQNLGIMHGDIKPQNILTNRIDNNHRVAVFADFGGATDDVVERAHRQVKTLNYVPYVDYLEWKQLGDEDNFNELRELEFKRDVFALGLVFYQALSQGAFPLAHDEDGFVDIYSDYRELGPEIPMQIQNMIGKMLNSNYRDRPTPQQCIDMSNLEF